MLEPNGPLPPEIYFRRRVLAIGVGVVVLALVVWLISSLGGGEDDPEADAAAATSSLTSAPPASAEQAEEKSADGDADDSGRSGEPGNAAAGAGGSDTSGSESSSASSTSGESTSAEPVPAGQCPDQSLAIKVGGDKPTYKLGEEPTFTTVVTNIGTAPCERDLGSGLQQVLVYTLDGNQRLWSNIDCYPQSEPDVRTLAPGEQAVFSVKWSAKTSAPDCLEKPEPQRQPIGPGAYTVVAQLGQLRSSPEPFNVG